MSKFSRSIVAAGIIMALGSIAFASDADIILKSNQGYVIDANGRVKVVDLKVDDAMMARAEVLKIGTTMFLHNGEVMMVSCGGLPSAPNYHPCDSH